MEAIFLAFDDSLRPLLKRGGGHGRVRYALDRRTTVKDVIEALGVPHTEVGRIRLGGQEAGFDRIVENGHEFQVDGVCLPMDITCPSRLRPQPLPAARFVVDVNVGKLALLLRVIGMDAAYDPGLSDGQIADLAVSDRRIVLTRDAGLLKRRQVEFGRLVRSIRPDDQLAEVVAVFGLRPPFALFSRCLRCNRRLEPVDKTAIRHRLEPKTRKYFHEFKRCPACDRIFWRGSHHDEMLARLRRAGVPGPDGALP